MNTPMNNPRFALGFGLALALAVAIMPTAVKAADPRPIIGDWEGTLDPGAQRKQRIVVHIAATQDGSLTGTLDYPDQDTSGIQMTAITYKEPALHFESTPDLTVYDGAMTKDNPPNITGTLKHAGQSLTLTLKRTP